MALQLIGSAAGTTTLTFPTHKIKDLLIIFAFCDGSVTNPTIGSGFTNITNTLDGTLCSVSMGYRIATVTNTSSGTWTNASRIVGVVLRGQQSNTSGTPLGSVAGTSGTTNTVTYTARTLAASGVIGSSWFLGFAGHASVDTTLESPPSGMTLIRNDVDATAEVSVFATTGTMEGGYGPAVGNWPSTNVSLTGTASNWITAVIEVKADAQEFNNYRVMGTVHNATGANPGILAFGGGNG